MHILATLTLRQLTTGGLLYLAMLLVVLLFIGASGGPRPRH